MAGGITTKMPNTNYKEFAKAYARKNEFITKEDEDIAIERVL